MTTETIRAEFEAAMIKHGEDAGYDESDMKPVRDGEGYAESHTQAAWWAWQAAFESEQVRTWRRDSEKLRSLEPKLDRFDVFDDSAEIASERFVMYQSMSGRNRYWLR